QGDLPKAFEPLLVEGRNEGRVGGIDGEGLRYGENPHQKGFFLRGRHPGEANVLHARMLMGKPLSAYGGILALNRPLDLALARRIAVPERFFEVLVAPEVAADALEALKN